MLLVQSRTGVFSACVIFLSIIFLKLLRQILFDHFAYGNLISTLSALDFPFLNDSTSEETGVQSCIPAPLLYLKDEFFLLVFLLTEPIYLFSYCLL